MADLALREFYASSNIQRASSVQGSQGMQRGSKLGHSRYIGYCLLQHLVLAYSDLTLV